MKRICIFVLGAAVGLGASVTSVTRAQGVIALTGTAQDQAGAVIPSEKLTLLNKATGETRKAKSDDSGQFSFSSVPLGEYILRGEADGFEPVELSITVGTQPLPPIKVKMEIKISEDVTVLAGQPELPENNADAVDFGNNLLAAIPTQMQDILPVLNNFFSLSAMEERGLNGPSIVVDGIETTGINVPTDAIKAASINRNPYSAEFRRPGSARLEVITRDGSGKHYDGSFGVYMRNGSLSALNAFATQKPDINLRLFEGRLGGPVPFVNNTKFFLSGSRKMDDETAVVNAVTLSGPLIENVPTFTGATNLFGRIDVKPNKLNRITLSYSFLDQPQRNLGVGGLVLREQAYSAMKRDQRFELIDSTAFSTKFLNTLRLLFQRKSQRSGNRADKPTIEVQGFFEGGPAQQASSGTENRLHFEDTIVYSHGWQTFRFGVVARLRFLKFTEATDFNGLFTFSDLSDFAAGRPNLFEIIQGNPDVSFSQHEVYGFFQDELRLAKHLNLMMGLRYEWQTRVGDHNNFAPRLALAFAPGNQKTVFRAGAGIFYEQLPDRVSRNSLLLDGIHTQDLVIENPSYPDPFKEGDPSLIKPSVWRLAPGLRVPYLFQGTLSLERKLGTATQLTVEYRTLRGEHLFRLRNINAPLGIDQPLPNPDFLLINQVESSSSLRTNALIVSLQGRFMKHLKGMAQYTLSRATDDTDGKFQLPANNYDLRPEWGPSTLDKRHRLNFVGTYSLPWDMRVAGVLSLATGGPFDITTGRDDNGDGVVNDRPPGVTRNTGRGPGYAQLDIRLSKFFSIPTPFSKELKGGKQFDKNLALNLDAFNVLNHNNLSNVIGSLSATDRFGRATISLLPRTIQLSLKYSF
jgi:hypothetical protein